MYTLRAADGLLVVACVCAVRGANDDAGAGRGGLLCVAGAAGAGLAAVGGGAAAGRGAGAQRPPAASARLHGALAPAAAPRRPAHTGGERGRAAQRVRGAGAGRAAAGAAGAGRRGRAASGARAPLPPRLRALRVRRRAVAAAAPALLQQCVRLRLPEDAAHRLSQRPHRRAGLTARPRAPVPPRPDRGVAARPLATRPRPRLAVPHLHCGVTLNSNLCV
ncbi:unnamed protein product [Spodoptera littoralis]|uniref:Uncharacterized protein n=1 Tax=Spodoptera littoralis TaxID=7109 RepID=A0A9P0MZ74_SPOLI|nr:unnamed protein product [Spodoptera littoralis]CAH1636682.1 unnamed protein product [Spodoptera littoralis]